MPMAEDPNVSSNTGFTTIRPFLSHDLSVLHFFHLIFMVPVMFKQIISKRLS